MGDSRYARFAISRSSREWSCGALILEQDRPIAESQRPEELPVDLSQELHIAGPDRASIAYRRRLAELAAEG